MKDINIDTSKTTLVKTVGEMNKAQVQFCVKKNLLQSLGELGHGAFIEKENIEDFINLEKKDMEPKKKIVYNRRRRGITEVQLAKLGIMPDYTTLNPDRFWSNTLQTNIEISKKMTLPELIVAIFEKGKVIGFEEGEKNRTKEIQRLLGFGTD